MVISAKTYDLLDKVDADLAARGMHDHTHRIFAHEFYRDKIAPLTEKQNLFAALDLDTEQIYEISSVFKKNASENSYDYEHPSLDKEYLRRLRNHMLSHYNEFVRRLNRLLMLPLQPMPTDDQVLHDEVIYGYMRIRRLKGQAAPQVLIKKDIHDLTVRASLDEWIEVPIEEFTFSFFYQQCWDKPIQRTHEPKQLLTRFASHLFALATWQMFNCIHDHSKMRKSLNAELEVALAYLAGRPTPYMSIHKLKCSDQPDQRTEAQMVMQIAGVFGFLFMHEVSKHFLMMEERGYMQVSKALIKWVKAHEYHDYEEAYSRNIPHTHPLGKILSSCIRIQKDKENIDRWRKEAPAKALYLAYLEHDLSTMKIRDLPSDYFRYENMVDSNGEKGLVYAFESKADMRRVFGLSEPVFKAVLGNTVDTRSKDDGGKYHYITQRRKWSAMVRWIGHTKYYAELKPWIVNLLKNQGFRLVNFVGGRDGELYRKPVCYALDLLYEYALQNATEQSDEGNSFDLQRNPLFMILLDYLSGHGYHRDAEGNLYQEFEYNVLHVGKTTTLNSLQIKALKWHRNQTLYESQKELENMQHLKKVCYTHANGISHTVRDHRFVSIDNAYDLAMEGIIMSHCVNTYDREIREERYAVFQALGAGKYADSSDHRATLGVRIEGSLFRFDQCFAHENHPVSEELLEDAYMFIAMLQAERHIEDAKNI